MTVTAPLPSSRTTLRALHEGAVRRAAFTGAATVGATAGVPGQVDPNEGVAIGALADDSGFDVRSSTSGSSSTVTVSGEIDGLTAPVLRDCLLDVLGRPDLSGDVVVDLSQVTFFSAAGLTVLVTAQETATRAGRVVGIRCGTARAVIHVLQVTGLWSVFAILE